MEKRKREKIIALMATMSLMAGSWAGLAVIAQASGGGSLQETVASYGAVEYTDASDDENSVVICAADISLLAGTIDAFKEVLVEELNNKGLHLNIDGTVGFSEDTGTQAYDFDFNTILAGIAASQSVPTNVAAASAQNISKESQAWVNGRLITGNGADEGAAYRTGYVEGLSEKVGGLSTVYNYHEHTDGSGNIRSEKTESVIYSVTDPGGCYVSAGHTHNATGTCAVTTHEAVYEDCGGVFEDGVCTVCRFARKGMEDGSPCTRQFLVSAAYTEYACGAPDNTWVIGCGKTEKTIESATIIIDN